MDLMYTGICTDNLQAHFPPLPLIFKSCLCQDQGPGVFELKWLTIMTDDGQMFFSLWRMEVVVHPTNIFPRGSVTISGLMDVNHLYVYLHIFWATSSLLITFACITTHLLVNDV